jgi:RelB Antitoxin alpha helical domain
MSLEKYPFVKELLKDEAGKVYRVAMDLIDYQRLLELIEDEGLYLAMAEVRDEVPISRAEALRVIESKEVEVCISQD